MKIAFLAFAAFAAHSVAGQFSGLPGCAYNCLHLTLYDIGCLGHSHTACVCLPGYVNRIQRASSPCMLEYCTQEVIEKMFDKARETCKKFPEINGHPKRQFVG